jgi:hypothetical protein
MDCSNADAEYSAEPTSEDAGITTRVSCGSSVSELEPECVTFLVLGDTFHCPLCDAEPITISGMAYTFVTETVCRDSYANDHVTMS